MNQLVRGAQRSRCLLRAGRLAFSTSESVTASSAVGGSASHQIIFTSSPLSCIERHLSSRSLDFQPNTAALYRSFSSLAVDVDTSEKLLDRANLEVVTPGFIIGFIQSYTAAHRVPIHQSDFIQLCESARAGKQKDAKVIAQALKEFKRINNFILEMPGASAAIDGMLRSMTPTWKIQDGKPKVRAALFVLEQILNDGSMDTSSIGTGLYFAVDSEMVDKVLDQLLDGLLDMQKSGMKLRLDSAAEEDEPKTVDEELLQNSLELTEDVISILLQRKCRPEWEMKKRAQRKYLKQLQFSGGPGRNTMKLATEITLLIGGTAAAKENIVASYDEAWKTKDVPDGVLELIADAEKMEKM